MCDLKLILTLVINLQYDVTFSTLVSAEYLFIGSQLHIGSPVSIGLAALRVTLQTFATVTLFTAKFSSPCCFDQAPISLVRKAGPFHQSSLDWSLDGSIPHDTMSAGLSFDFT